MVRLILGFSYFVLLVISSCLPRVTSLSFDYNFTASGVLAGADLKCMNDSAPALDRIDLTNLSRSWSTGRVAHQQAVRLWDDSTGKLASFTTNFTFVVKALNETTSQGDGVAFFVGPYPASLPTDATGGFLALFNNRGNPANTYFPPTVGVEFNTFRNADWDPADTMNHLGVNANSIRSKEYAALPDGIFKWGHVVGAGQVRRRHGHALGRPAVGRHAGAQCLHRQRQSRPAGRRPAAVRGGRVLGGHRRLRRAAPDYFLVVPVPYHHPVICFHLCANFWFLCHT